MREECCERCDCIIGLGCACSAEGSAPRRGPAVSASRPRQKWQRFAEETILISHRGYAHMPGACTHVSEEYVTAPRWGWIPNPPPGLWGRLSSSYPAVATEGNTARQAVRRCEECEGTLPIR